MFNVCILTDLKPEASGVDLLCMIGRTKFGRTMDKETRDLFATKEHKQKQL